ncbi:MAG: hypothetical protein KDK90_28110 [Leptospiraceae bacterium]|nr:hypothetical protein [Leptospiraceae bacterium]
MEDEIKEFCSTIRSRSKEHQDAFNLLVKNGNYGLSISILRQEIDSLIRAAYIYCLGIKTDEAEKLIKDFVEDKKWFNVTNNGKRQLITDKEMVNLHGGWVSVVYDFGCKLIHLSKYNAYKKTDPFINMETDKKNEIIGYLKYHHEYNFSDISLNKLIPYLPKIMHKIVDNSILSWFSEKRTFYPLKIR